MLNLDSDKKSLGENPSGRDGKILRDHRQDGNVAACVFITLCDWAITIL